MDTVTTHKGLRIAIVEDVPMIANLYSIGLKSKGHDIIMVARSGEEMLRALDEERAKDIDVAIVDYRLGASGMDGLTCAKSILARNPKTKIIMATADDSVKKETDGSSIQLLTKPFSINMLLDSVSGISNSVPSRPR